MKLNLRICSFFILFFSSLYVNAQLIATYPLKSGGTNPPVGTASPSPATSLNINAGTISVGSEIISATAGTYNSTGLRVRPNTLAWSNSPNDNFTVNVPLSPKTGFDFVLTSVTFKNNALDNSPNLLCQLAYQVNGVGTWNYIGTPQAVTAANLGTTITIGGLNEGYYNGATYIFRFFFYGVGANDKNQGFRMADLVFNGNVITPPSITPTVITGNLGVATKYSNTVTSSSYTISNAGINIKVVKQSGVCFSTGATPTINNNITIDPATNAVSTATFNSIINGLTPNTTYYTRAYALTQVDTVYGLIKSFVTLPQTPPTLNTNPPINVLSNKATTGGNNIDSGGYAVLEKGVLFSTNNILTFPTTTHTSDGVGNSNFTTILKNLSPLTKYYIKAYARNQLGVGYGNLDSFTTTAPVPSITVTPSTLDFGDVIFNAVAPILSYKINATYLNPNAGSITLTATNGYKIATTLNGLYANSLPLSYSSSTITNKIIYVKSPSSNYGMLTGFVLHSGGGTIAPNADTTFLATNIIQNQDTLSNSGSDFWCGFGYQEKMSQVAGNSSEAKLSIYITTGNQPATVHVDLTSGGYSQVQTIPANSYFEFKNFPTGDASNKLNPSGLPDSRLYATGKSNRSIHIYTDNGVPVSAFMHSYTNSNTAAGAMLFPSNTWNSNYTVQAFGGQSNSSNPNSYFFVIANENNTPVTFTLKNDVVDSNSNTIFSDNHTATDVKYKKDSTYTVILNKGQIFNAMGFVSGTGSGVGTGKATGLDLSGSTVKTTCDKKITVFAGNGRCLINGLTGTKTSGSDHLIQQMFPSVAWGTKYLTVPTKGEPLNYYRIYVQNPTVFGTTNVWVNNPAHTTPLVTLINNLYYEYESNQPLLIESDKPINVTQFVTTPYSGAPSVDGGPEMIMLSPVQQTITNATVYAASGKDASTVQTNAAGTSGNHASFINIIIPTSAVGSFRLDNSNLVDTGRQVVGACAAGGTGNCSDLFAKGTKVDVNLAFRKHPQDTSYSIANFWVQAPAVHTLTASKGFNAIAYGFGVGESYGYNAGTAINNLSSIKFSLNPNGSDTSTTSVKTCKGNLVTLQIALPYDTTTVNSIIWDPGSDGTRYTPTGPQAGQINPSTSKPQVVGTITRDGRIFYIYRSPVQYTFLEEGAYKVKVTISGTFASDCGGSNVEYLNVIVGHDDILFTATPGGCSSTNVTIADASTPLSGTSITKWLWDFGDNKKDTINFGDATAPNPKINPHTYPANNAYTIKLTTINSVGCFSYDSVAIDLAFNISSNFTTYRDTACVGESVVFTPTSTSNAVKWFWDFGDSSPIDSSNNSPNSIAHSYSSSGNYFVNHWVKNAAGCSSAIVKDTVVISKTPIASFVTPAGVCLPSSTQFINSSDTGTLGAATPYVYHWNFGTGNIADTSNVKNPLFTYTATPPPGGYPVTLTATSRFGCLSSVYTNNIVNVYTKPTAVISNTSDKKTCQGSAANFYDASFGTNQTVNTWYWNFGDGNSSVAQNPTNTYTNNQLFTVKLAIVTDKGCKSDTTTWSIKVNPKPVAKTILPSSCITSGSLTFTDNSSVAPDDSTQTPYSYTWNFGDPASGALNTATTKDGTHTYSTPNTYYIAHSITTVNGCTDTKIDTFDIAGSKPVPGFEIINNLNLCSNGSVTLKDTSRVTIGTIKKVEIRWDVTNNYNMIDVDNSPSNGTIGSSKNYTHKYPSLPTNKTYSVRLYAYSGVTCLDSLDKTITVYGSPKVIFDTIPGVCVNAAPKSIKLARDSSGIFNNPLLTNYFYSGTSVSNDSFYASIAGVGQHFIKAVFVTKTPANGCKDSAIAPIKVWGLPTVNVNTSTPLCEKNVVAFSDISIPASGSGNIKSWLWNFGDPSSGALDSSKIKNPNHTYSNYGTYNVALKVTSDSGCVGILTPLKTITIHPKPKAGFIPPNGICAPSGIAYFTDTSKIADGSESMFTHFWNFGDPASGSNNTAIGTPLPNPSHMYTGVPTDSLKLIVTSKDGCKDSVTIKMSNNTIHPQPKAGFKVNGFVRDTARVCLGNALSFSDNSNIGASVNYWIWGDNGSIIENGSPINHTFASSNTFNGIHFIDDIYGCRSDTIKVISVVWSLPTISIGVSSPTCEKNAITFTDNSTTGVGSGNIKTWLWKFGDPSSGAFDSAITAIPSHTYNTFGSYNVFLTATSDSGCKATNSPAKIVTVNPKPSVGFVVPSSVCLPFAAQFTDTSKISDGSQNMFTHTWNFGDPASGVNNISMGTPLINASHVYSSSNNYTIKLIVKSKDGCTDSLSKPLTSAEIHPQPKSNYVVSTPNKDTPRVCLGLPITFRDSSNIVTAGSYWIYGDNGFTTQWGSNPPPYYYNNAGTFYGMHFIDDTNGCRSDTNRFVSIIDSFPVVISDQQYILAGTSVKLTPYISGGVTYLWTPVSPAFLIDDYLDSNNIKNPICTPLDSVVYKISVTGAGGCKAPSAFYAVKVFNLPIIPNAFTPNNDGINDTWDLSTIKFFNGASVQVFTRWGQPVFSSLGYSKPWNGNTTTGIPLPTGTYYYVIKLSPAVPIMSGSITIIR